MSKAKGVRSPQSVIDQAIAENRPGEYLLYGFAVTFVVVGLALIGFGIYRNSNYALVAGSVESALFLPAMRWAWKIRRENIAIRLLEAALSHASSANEAAEAIRKFFEGEMGDRKIGSEK
jgi:hypothetical protein